ncbi:conserved hypothetical protein [Rippkaea orientalis PCC 8801]|uniref:Glycosyl transferase family 2 n=1 Tax=Rippkaea orientalis (strain PCC 8801 / RF-1) TaxID=41431 RepID=B7K317_RIPO1|nr:hypothetical protein [Rippkaea orientalis]ACK67718.1 conserved hypothetical protein [Rippkaea orientalis PCC 8801]
MSLPSCSLWIFVARTDVPFILYTIPHLVKMNNFPFEEKVLAIDTAPLTGDKVSRLGIGTMEELRNCTQKLLKSGVVDRVVDINYETSYRHRLSQKHFGSPLRSTHNYKGYPILGSIFTIEECKSEYMLHFDSDMLLHQDIDYNWIAEGIKLMQKYPKMMSIRPLTGPPAKEGKIYQFSSYEEDPDGFYRFKFFGSRVYLINCQQFASLTPFPIIWCSYRQKFIDQFPLGLKILLNNLTGKGKLESWEVMVSKKLEESDYFRAVLTQSKAWTLHPKDRSPEFIQALPDIIKRIEAGDYPIEQAGHYDLIPELWY